MIRQSFVYDEQQGQLIPRPTPDDSYRQQVEREREMARQARERQESLEHPGVYL